MRTIDFLSALDEPAPCLIAITPWLRHQHRRPRRGSIGQLLGAKNFGAAWRTQPPDRICDVPGLEAYHGQESYLTAALTRAPLRRG